MEYAANDLICKCRKVTMADIDRALHSHGNFADVEAEFRKIQEETSCSTGCGGCHDKVMAIISEAMSG